MSTIVFSTQLLRQMAHITSCKWRMLFLLEGFPSVMAAVVVYTSLPDAPGQARFLDRRQRSIATQRIAGPTYDHASSRESESSIRWADVRQTLLDPQAYLTAFSTSDKTFLSAYTNSYTGKVSDSNAAADSRIPVFFCSNVAFSSLPVFLPTIINEMGYSPLTAQALSAPPYLVASISVLLTAWTSDRRRTRYTFIVFHALLAAAGYTLMAIAGWRKASPLTRYIGIYPAACGFFSAITIVITWNLNNQRSSTGRGIALSLLNYIGQLGPLIGTSLYPDRDAPYYIPGMIACACFMSAVAVLALISAVILARRNISLDKRCNHTTNHQHGMTETFRYLI